MTKPTPRAIRGVLAEVKTNRKKSNKVNKTEITFEIMFLNAKNPNRFRTQIMIRKIPVKLGLLKFKVKPAPLFKPLHVLAMPVAKLIAEMKDNMIERTTEKRITLRVNFPVAQRNNVVLKLIANKTNERVFIDNANLNLKKLMATEKIMRNKLIANKINLLSYNKCLNCFDKIPLIILNMSHSSNIKKHVLKNIEEYELAFKIMHAKERDEKNSQSNMNISSNRLKKKDIIRFILTFQYLK